MPYGPPQPARYDPPCTTGLVASGSNVLVFTTGRGSVLGLKPTPCIKVATNSPLYERMSDGQEATWGEVLVWDAPSRIVLTWHPGDEDASRATEIEVRFTPEGDGTRVDLEHRGWERLGEQAAEAQAGYDGGWEAVLATYAEAASA